MKPLTKDNVVVVKQTAPVVAKPAAAKGSNLRVKMR